MERSDHPPPLVLHGLSSFNFPFPIQTTKILFFHIKNSLSQHFNFSRSIRHRGQVLKYRIVTVNYKGSYPMQVTRYRQGLYATVYLFESFKQMTSTKAHDNFPLGGVNFLIHSPFDMISKESASHQTIPTHSLVVYLNPQKSIIDEALEKYEPKRLEPNES
jgi:hypothetical protein